MTQKLVTKSKTETGLKSRTQTPTKQEKDSKPPKVNGPKGTNEQPKRLTPNYHAKNVNSLKIRKYK